MILLAAFPAAAESFRVATWASLSDRAWSRPVQLVYEAEGARWKHAESSRVLAHAATRAEVEQILEEAHAAWAAVGAQLALPATSNRVRLVCVYEESTWERLVRSGGIRRDGLALQVGRDILLNAAPEQTRRADRIAHEVVHFRLREAYGERLPLWLEEGLATRLGVEIARNEHAARGVRLAGVMPGIPEEAACSPAQFFDGDAYPESPAAAQAFGRQAAELVGLLAERIGGQAWPGAVAAMSRAGDWRKALKSGYGVDVNDLEQLNGQAVERARRPWTF